MRVIKLLSVVLLMSIINISCQSETDENVVFYSKDQLINSLPVQIKNTEGSLISVNSNTVIGLSSSSFFNEHMVSLKELNVPSMSFKIRNYNSNSSLMSNIKVFLDEIQITNDLGVNFLNAANNNIKIDITNQQLLETIASKLLQKKEVVISFYSDAVTQDQMAFDFEFCITANGTFVD
ncbi:MAG: hypothetical protein ACI9SI_001904 [Polaribacter sp.]|jgi:hypothetical protein